jgi:cyclase
MLRPRIIPCLLVHKGGLVKTQNFKDPKYVGDPINAVRIFNEKESDELMVLDIDATVHGHEPDYVQLRNVAVESRMPLCYGGGITEARQAGQVIALDSSNNYIQADGITVTASGISDLIIVANGTHVMIVPKGRSQDVKKITEALKAKG